jgi:protein SCO1/2
MTSGVRMGLFAALAVAGGVGYVMSARPAIALPEYGSVPAFQLSDERGAPYDRSALIGKVTVVDFVFTSCSTICPTLSASMETLQREVASRHRDRVRLLSVSVDPERDTPERLRELGARYHADPALWHFVRGSDAAIKTVVVDGLKQAMERNADPSATDATSILHSMRFVLVDDQARIRGFYDATDPQAMAQLREHIDTLVEPRWRGAASP